MNRRMLIAALLSAGLGIMIGGLAVYTYGKKNPAAFTPLTPWTTKAVVFGEQFDVSELLERAKPKEAKFLIAPGGESGLTRYGYDGCKSAVWEGPTDPEAVKEFILKELESRFRARKWDTERGSGMSAASAGDTFLSWHELRYHLPDYSAAGWARLFIHREGQRVSVALVFNTGCDWPTD
jgi:hypothetical protein